ncbi:hypothetical protein [Teredinibacter waterburyi]|uniref:hypothetical protein n=1 Tax=Teredinibacter waterburyi TaxID=1500538 RepID=UPI00165F8491|nr:hypothetical protein [Teredinibacter waterburyi]
MPLNAAVKQEVIKNTEKYEGRIPHLYLDSRGKVTVGIGHLIPNKSAMAAVPMFKKNANNVLVLASLAEKYAEYDTIKKQPYGFSHNARFYAAHTTLVMKDHDIATQKERHILSFYTELAAYYTTTNGFTKKFDVMPHPVQQALFDMVFNLGITKLRAQYVKMNNSIKIENWATAAAESKRPQIGMKRNNYVESLFLSAQNQPATP